MDDDAGIEEAVDEFMESGEQLQKALADANATADYAQNALDNSK